MNQEEKPLFRASRNIKWWYKQVGWLNFGEQVRFEPHPKFNFLTSTNNKTNINKTHGCNTHIIQIPPLYHFASLVSATHSARVGPSSRTRIARAAETHCSEDIFSRQEQRTTTNTRWHRVCLAKRYTIPTKPQILPVYLNTDFYRIMTFQSFLHSAES